MMQELLICDFVKPIDIDEIDFSCQNSKVIVTLEENAKFGGAGS